MPDAHSLRPTPTPSPAVQDMHTEAWWIRVMDDANSLSSLTPEETRRWDAHLATCEACRAELRALMRADAFLAEAPTVPALSPDFTVATVQAIVSRQRSQRRRRALGFLAGALVVGIASLLVVGATRELIAAIGPGFGAFVAARDVLFRSFVHTLVGLLVRWRRLVPYLLGIAALAYALMMPNGLLMTFALVWLSSRRRDRGIARA